MLNIFSSKKIVRFSLPLLLAASVAMLTGCGGGGAAAGTAAAASGIAATTTAASAVPVAATLSLSASPTTVKSDNTTSTTITIAALNAGNAAVPGVTVNLSADTGALGAASVVTGATGTGTVTFTTGASKINRTATITATAGLVSAIIPVQVVGSTVTLASSGTTLPAGGLSPVTLTITAKDAGGNIVPNAAVTLTQTGTGSVTLTPIPATGITDVNGKITVTVAGATAGAVTVSASALGATGTTALTVSPTAATFAIDQQTLNGVIVAGNPKPTAMKIGVPNALAIRVNAPAPTTSVTFATTTGVWNGTTSVVTVLVVAGKATATLTTTQAGNANIQVYDTAVPTTSDTLSVGMTSATAASITLQPTPAVVPRSVGTTTGSSTLVAMVRDLNGAPVGGVPVAFSIVNPTGGGETVSPVVVFSAATTAGGLSLGEARATFTSGSLSTAATGVQIRASVVGSTVATNVAPSGADATIVIGGTAGSVAFGQATSIATDATGANYVLNMSVLVADSNGNPAPLGTTVNLSSWPIAWSTGSACLHDADAAYVLPVAPATVGTAAGTFLNEDINENLVLDAGEDDMRTRYSGSVATGPGTVNGALNPPNSAGGTLPASVLTDANGVAGFTLTYTKTNAIWIVTRIRARATVQGTETVGEVKFRLASTIPDTVPCILPPSPYSF